MNSKVAWPIWLVSIYLILAILSGYFVFLHFNQENLLTKLCQEDGVIEWLTAIFYFGSSFLFLYGCKKENFKNLWYWFFIALFFVIAAEEISWGQRLFGFMTPENISNVNVQDEFNLHNTEGIHDKVRAVGLSFVLVVCYFLPVSNWLSSRLNSFYRKMRLPIYPLKFVGITTVAILFMVVPRLLWDSVIFNLDEIGEIYLSVGFLMFALNELFHTKSYSL